MSTDSVPLAQPFLATRPESALPSRIEITTDVSGFDGLREEWNSLLGESRSDSVFLTWEWLHTWWTHLAPRGDLALVTLRRGRELVALAPFVTSGPNWLGIRTFSFLGTGRVGSDYLDVIARSGAEEEAVVHIARHLVEAGVKVEMRQLRIASSLGSALARELRLAGCPVRARRTHRCPIVDLSGRSWESYLASLGSEHRYNFQRKLRKLEAQRDFRFERITSETRRREVLPILFELHRQRWSERGGSDGLTGPNILAFHQDFTRLALEQGWLRLFVLWLDGSPAAALYGLRYGSVFSFYQSGFDPAYRRLGVGTVSLGLAIKSALAEGASAFDFLHGEEAYKFHWARRTLSLGRIVAFPRGAAGRAAWLGAAAWDLGRAGANRLSRLGHLVKGGPRAAPPQ